MRGRRVVGHDGRTWRVRRRWLPWQPRVRRRRGDALDGADAAWFGGELLDGLDSPVGFVVGIVAAIAFGIAFVLVLPFALALLEVLLLLVLLPAVVVARVVLRTPWIVEAHTTGPPPERRARAVVGWRASRAVIDEVAQEISLGEHAR